MKGLEVTRVGIAAGALALAIGAHAAGPQHCAAGFQDSACVTQLSHAAAPQPQCPTGAGWMTVAASTWIGSTWTSPQCSYQAPPTCPAGYSQTSAPWWTGSSWVGLSCAPPPPPPSDDADPLGFCTPKLAQPGYTAPWAPLKLVSWPEVVSGTQNNPYEGQLVYAWYLTGPTYSLACRDDNLYIGECFFSSADHHYLGTVIAQGTGGTGGNCGH